MTISSISLQYALNGLDHEEVVCRAELQQLHNLKLNLKDKPFFNGSARLNRELLDGISVAINTIIVQRQELLASIKQAHTELASLQREAEEREAEEGMAVGAQVASALRARERREGGAP